MAKKADSIYVDCPSCGSCQRIHSNQNFNNTIYDIDSAPKELVKEVKKQGKITCNRCLAKYKIKTFSIQVGDTVLV